MADKINSFNETIIIEPNKPYFPKFNKFGYADIPYVKVMLLAGDIEREFLGYTWSCTSVTSTSMTIQLVFEYPLKISSSKDKPEQLQFEFHVQEFKDSNGKGIRDNLQIQKYIPR